MLNRFSPANKSSIVKKCEAELEVKYTKLLTQEFCVGWIKTHNDSSISQSSLQINQSSAGIDAAGNKIHELRLDIFEKDENTGAGISRCCCLIFALDIESALRHNLVQGSGTCLFTDI